jgi:peptidoglycan/LPS O-acetylase OafA/YrhL
MMEANSAYSQKYIPALDGLRAVSILLVILFHIKEELVHFRFLYFVAEHGWYGVDVFFTLSGFLITWMLLKEIDNRGKINIVRFYIRRGLRLWPAYFVYLIIVGAAIYLRGTHRQLENYLSALPYLITYTSNYLAIYAPDRLPLLLHTWSLCVEEQFYLAFPLVLLLFSCESAKHILLAIICTICGIRVLVVVHAYFYLQYFTPLRIDTILAGCVVAIVFRKMRFGGYRFLENRILQYAGVIIWGGCIMMFANEGSKTLYIIGLPLLYLFSALNIYMIANGFPVLLVKILEFKTIVYIGKISYGIYLVHVICMVFVLKCFGYYQINGYPRLIIVVTLSVITPICSAAIMYKYVEKPILLIKERYRS